MLTIETVEDVKSFSRLKPFWNDLLSSSDVDFPFMDLDWLALWWRFCGKNSEMLMFVIKRDGNPVGIVPLMRKNILWRGLPATCVSFIADHFSCRTGIISCIPEENLFGIVFDTLRQMRKKFDLLWLDLIEKGSTTDLQLRETLRDRKFQYREMAGERSPKIILEGDWASYVSGRSKNFREKIRRTHKGFEKTEYRLIRYSSAQFIPEAMRKIVEISKNTWKFKAGTAIASDKRKIDFYREMAHFAAEKHWLKILVLEVAEKPVAFTYELVYKDRDYFVKTGYDEIFSRLSPGIFILCNSIRQAFDEGIREYDLLGKEEDYKLKFASGIREHSKFWIFDGSAGASILLAWEKGLVMPAKSLLQTVQQRFQPQQSVPA